MTTQPGRPAARRNGETRSKSNVYLSLSSRWPLPDVRARLSVGVWLCDASRATASTRPRAPRSLLAVVCSDSAPIYACEGRLTPTPNDSSLTKSHDLRTQNSESAAPGDRPRPAEDPTGGARHPTTSRSHNRTHNDWTRNARTIRGRRSTLSHRCTHPTATTKQNCPAVAHPTLRVAAHAMAKECTTGYSRGVDIATGAVPAVPLCTHDPAPIAVL
jgi:hypothetical protein